MYRVYVGDLFHTVATKVSDITGSAWAFLTALSIIIIWGFSGPIFHYSDTWQLIINTSTTIVTFLMVFLIQNTQNRDAKAIHIKLDELIKATKGARNSIVDTENLSDDELKALHNEFSTLHKDYEKELRRRKKEKHAKST